MSTIKPKWQMSEEDIKFHYITPAIESKWGKDRITMETKITDGRINLRGNFVVREKPKRADYILYINANNDRHTEGDQIRFQHQLFRRPGLHLQPASGHRRWLSRALQGHRHHAGHW